MKYHTSRAGRVNPLPYVSSTSTDPFNRQSPANVRKKEKKTSAHFEPSDTARRSRRIVSDPWIRRGTPARGAAATPAAARPPVNAKTPTSPKGPEGIHIKR